MWVNPKFATALPPPAQAPPEPTGKHLITFDRSHGGKREELRVTLNEYEGHPFINLRVWAEIDGCWTPLKGKGCSIRLKECTELAAVLQRAGDWWARDHDRPRQVRATTQARPPRQEPRRLMPLLGPPRDDRDFDEFGGDDR